MHPCEPFTGPLTASAIITWLDSCETTFEEESYDNGRVLPDRLKINYAGKSIDPEADILHKWWATEQASLRALTWNEFKDALKSHALGGDWKLQVLEDFYRVEQGSDTVEEFISNLRSTRLLVLTSGLQVITDDVYKCHLLFCANPTVTALVRSAIGFDFESVSPSQLEKALRNAGREERRIEEENCKCKIEDKGKGKGKAKGKAKGKGKGAMPSTSKGTDTPPPYADPESWALSDKVKCDTPAVGYYNSFDNRDLLPPSPDTVGRVVSIAVSSWYSPSNVRIVIQDPESRAIWDLAVPQGADPKEKTLELKEGEYIECLAVAKLADRIDGLRFETSKGRTLIVGTVGTDLHLFRAPYESRIVGLHGMAGVPPGSAANWFSEIGVIFAPLLPGEQ